MATIKGQNLRLFLEDGYPLASSESCTVHIQMEVGETSTKDTTDDWQTNEVIGMSWDCSAEALITTAPGGQTPDESLRVEDLQDMMEAKTIVDVAFNMTNGRMNRDNGGTLMKGQAVITDLQITAQNRQNSTYSIKMQGVGELTLCPMATPSFTLPIVVKNITTSDYILLSQEMTAAELVSLLIIEDSTGTQMTVTNSSGNLVVKKSSTSLFTLVKDSSDAKKWNVALVNSSSTIQIKTIMIDND